jgi:hypothetical protein
VENVWLSSTKIYMGKKEKHRAYKHPYRLKLASEANHDNKYG